MSRRVALRCAGLLVIGVIVFDQLTKYFFTHIAQPVSFGFDAFITTTKHQNFGLIGNLPMPRMAIVFVTLVVSGIVLAAMFRAYQSKRISLLPALALILGGAMGNLSDRLVLGYVFDWILLFHISILNVADIAIGVGLVWYLIDEPVRTCLTMSSIRSLRGGRDGAV